MEVRTSAGQENGAGEAGAGELRHKGSEGQGGLQGLTEQALMGLGEAVAGVGTARCGQRVGKNWGRWLGAPVVWGTLT